MKMRQIVEYLTPDQRARYSEIQINHEVRAATDHFFGVGNDMVREDVPDNTDSATKGEVHLAIERAIGQEISVEDYRRGTVKDRYNRDVKIGRLLKDEKLRNQFASDPARQGVRKSGYYATIHRGTEVAGQTNSAPDPTHPQGHSWGGQSCKNVDTGGNRHYLEQEIRAGTVVIFVHEPSGKEIYRATLHPHLGQTHGGLIYVVDAEYGVERDIFTEFSKNVSRKLSAGASLDDVYVVNSSVYNDNGAHYATHPDFSFDIVLTMIQRGDLEEPNDNVAVQLHMYGRAELNIKKSQFSSAISGLANGKIHPRYFEPVMNILFRSHESATVITHDQVEMILSAYAKSREPRAYLADVNGYSFAIFLNCIVRVGLPENYLSNDQSDPYLIEQLTQKYPLTVEEMHQLIAKFIDRNGGVLSSRILTNLLNNSALPAETLIGVIDVAFQHLAVSSLIDFVNYVSFDRNVSHRQLLEILTKLVCICDVSLTSAVIRRYARYLSEITERMFDAGFNYNNDQYIAHALWAISHGYHGRPVGIGEELSNRIIDRGLVDSEDAATLLPKLFRVTQDVSMVYRNLERIQKCPNSDEIMHNILDVLVTHEIGSETDGLDLVKTILEMDRSPSNRRLLVQYRYWDDELADIFFPTVTPRQALDMMRVIYHDQLVSPKVQLQYYQFMPFFESSSVTDEPEISALERLRKTLKTESTYNY